MSEKGRVADLGGFAGVSVFSGCRDRTAPKEKLGENTAMLATSSREVPAE